VPITGIDHIMLAVPDLDKAVAELTGSVGLRTTRSAVHPDFGTANQTVRLPGLYLELITITDPAKAATWHVGQRIAEVCGSGGGLLAFVLGVEDMPATVAALRAKGLPINEPFQASGVRDDGSTIRHFSIASHGEEFLAGRLPSLIEYGQPGQTDPAPTDLGYALHGLVGVDVAVDELAAGIERYSALFGQAPTVVSDPLLDVPTARYHLPDGRTVRLLDLGRRTRQGLFGIALAVSDLDAAQAAITGRGVEVVPTGVEGELLLDPDRTLNARISLRAAPADQV
jgi:catechol 2,3-dioxygenase-like lactoylglutathione lyase family enzyme